MSGSVYYLVYKPILISAIYMPEKCFFYV